MTKVKVTLNIDLDLLRKARKEAGIINPRKEPLTEAIEQELGWVNASGISVASIKEVSKESEIEEALGQYLSTESEHFPKVIAALKKALRKSPDKMVDDVEFDIGSDDEVEMTSISMWEPLEYKYTVKNFCKMIGLQKGE